MEATEHYYYKDPYARELDVRVRHVFPLQGFQPPLTAVVLDRSICYPEGGGQPGDRGMLGPHQIVDCQKAKNLGSASRICAPNDIVHMIPLTALVKEGEEFTLTLDWQHRFDYMQQHSGQHLISAAFWQIGKYPTVSVHQGSDYSTVEFEAGDIPDADIEKAQSMANAAIAANLDIRSRIVNPEEIQTMPLRRSLKTDRDIRIVEIGRFGEIQRLGTSAKRFEIMDEQKIPLPFDCVGCGGVHLTQTAQVRLIEHIKTEKIRGRVRLYWKIGNRALQDYRLKHLVSDEVSSMLSTSIRDIPARVEQMNEELGYLRRELRELRRSALYRELDGAIDEALEHAERGTAQAVFALLNGADMNMMRDSVKRMQKRGVQHAALVGIAPDDRRKILWCVMDSRENCIDYAALKTHVLDPIGARGGGKAPLWQGSLMLAEDQEDANPDIQAEGNQLLAQLKNAIEQ